MIRFQNTFSLTSAWHHADVAYGPDFTWTSPNNTFRHMGFALHSQSIRARSAQHHHDTDLAIIVATIARERPLSH